MAITVSIETGPAPYGNKKLVTGTITMDSSYPTNGEAYDAGQFRMGKLTRLQLFPADAYIPDVDFANSKIKVFAIPAIAVHTHAFSGSALATHDHDVLITGGQAAGEALQQLSSVIGKTAATSVTDITSVQGISGGTPAGVNADGGSVAQKATEEVTNGTDLSAVVFPFTAIGYG